MMGVDGVRGIYPLDGVGEGGGSDETPSTLKRGMAASIAIS